MPTGNEQVKYHVIGLMSGTSLDGLDIAEVLFSLEGNKWEFQLLNATTVSYDAKLEESLRHAVNLNGYDLTKLHHNYGKWTGKKISEFLKTNSSKAELICSHGHTVFHQPKQGFTLQIGHGQEIANHSQTKTICDFRSLDVSLGGQGAPLVPIGDELLFKEYSHCLNLGGIANVSFKEGGTRISFDICIANMALNQLAAKLGLPFDEDGKIAESGNIISEVLEDLNNLEYYRMLHPKSLGFEQFQSEFMPIIENSNHKTQDLLRTVVEHIAIQITTVINRHSKHNDNMIITGGGAFNKFLISRIKKSLKTDIELVIPENDIVSYKEAIIFAFLGVLRIRNESNCLSSVTGANSDSCGGVIFNPA